MTGSCAQVHRTRLVGRGGAYDSCAPTVRAGAIADGIVAALGRDIVAGAGIHIDIERVTLAWPRHKAVAL